MRDFNISQLTKEMVAARLKILQDPCDAAAEIAKKTLIVALKDAPQLQTDTAKIVSDVCQGTMTGLIISDQNITKGAICLLNKISDASIELKLDPTEMMQMALKGIAEIKRFATEEQLDGISREISVKFMGAGEYFVSLLRTTQAVR